MQCVHCSTPVPDDAKFCHSCGSQVSDAEGQKAATASMDSSSFAHMEKLLREDAAGDFDIHKLLGRGGMAVVYLATEKKLGRKVAIKVLPPELTFGHGVDRFLREAKTAAALDHPNIIPIYRVASEGKLFWYAMKFLEGHSLDEVLKEKGKLPLPEVIEILDQVADALDYAHEHKVIHRDIKPANVMLDSRNRVIVTDFGIAKALTEQTLTASGSVVGTPYYMSPEQGMGRPVTGRSDQYSVSVMAFRMISGQVPFEGDSAIDILHKHCMIAPPRMETIAPGLPPHVYQAIHKALEKKADLRFKTVSGFVKALREPTPELEISSESATVMVDPAQVSQMAHMAASQAATMLTPRPGVTTPPTPAPRVTPKPEKKSRRGLVMAAGLVGVLGAAGAGWVVFGPSGDDGAGAAPAQQAAAPGGASPGATAPAVTASPQEPAGQPAAPATPRAEPVAATTGQVTVTGLPSGGTITVDGRPQSGPSFELTPGRHGIRMNAAGYQAVSVDVTIAAGDRVQVPFTGVRVVTAPAAEPQRPAPVAAQPPAGPAGAEQPSGGAAASQLGLLRIGIQGGFATVIIDNVSKGQASRHDEPLIPGTHQVRLEREGYITIDTAVTVGRGDTVIVRFRLQPRS